MKDLLFSDYLEIYEKVYYSNSKIYEKEIKQLSNFFPKLSGKLNILDIGCANGRHAVELLKNGHLVDCIDISSKAIKLAKLNLKKYGTTPILADIVNYKINKKYDVVLAIFMVLSYIKKYDIKKVIKNVYSMLDNEGVFIFDVINSQTFNSKFSKEMTVNGKNIEIKWIRTNLKSKECVKGEGIIKRGKEILKDIQYWYYYSPKEIRTILKESGFKNVKIYSNYKKSRLNPRKKLHVVCQK